MSNKPGKLRIIAGKWRGRLIPLLSTEAPSLRPTPDRVREDVFNWLAPFMHGAHCVDLFAGSGLLSFEALSRGAAHIHLVEKDKRVFAHLKQCAAAFPKEQISLYQQDALDLRLAAQPLIDIVFMDPPFQAQLLTPSCKWLTEQVWLAPQALIYIEKNATQEFIPPVAWQLLKTKQAGQVSYHLYQTTTEEV